MPEQRMARSSSKGSSSSTASSSPSSSPSPSMIPPSKASSSEAEDAGMPAFL
eukprot:CAMPEP_0194761556 /NCGR_PEP_ID=MMETSP0323_2-20130528/14241_1 /TAXON_ID=2866 ORGANISM="Crypthecodinium cohnii, Strain Seligo" /NCGR_SAMPLE_ID=MMETSP0323_2 /ASSEMBLY_ACC=CAM_ASM_000346 /LENGTH=51 /DNA_ID=CAMNT_0039683343 /DNA_START=521 /DNA_END=676 /DNA_ORIENTATION=-